jgi:hypothetical protein
MVLIYVPFQASAMAVDSSGVYALLAGWVGMLLKI